MNKHLSLSFILKSILYVSFLAVCVALGAFFFLMEYPWIDLSLFEKNKFTTTPSIVLDDEGKEIFKFEQDKREPITYQKLPPILIKAFIATEDRNFFNHYGISIKGIIRSFITNLRNQKAVQGGSTITQQLARLMFLSTKRTYIRKLKEIFVALQLEKTLSKEQIFELYVNNIYFGRGIYGVEAACRRFWNKSVLNINLQEAAILAAVTRSAKIYSPLNSTEMAQKRRDIILKSMLNLNFITLHQYENEIKKEIIINDFIPGNPITLYLKEWIRAWAEKKWGKDALYHEGLRIKTTINQKMQKTAEKIFKDKIQELQKNICPEIDGGMISLEVHSGRIKTLIGGIDFHRSQFNRALCAVRQLGSAFKPIIYTAALQNGFNMHSVMVDEPIEITLPNGEIWRPKNWTGRFEGKMTLLRALSFSNNIITIKLFNAIGGEKIVNLAKKFRLKRNLQPYPALALGTAEGTVKECAAAFNVFANNGEYVKPYIIEWVKDKNGNKIWEKEEERETILENTITSKMVNALSYRIKRAKQAYGSKEWIKSEAIGKSGSTNGATTTWFVGATPHLTTAVYIGKDDNSPMGKHVFASKTAFPIWLEFTIKTDKRKKMFYKDPSLQEVLIDWISGEKINKPTTHQENLVKILVKKDKEEKNT